jgi:L-gulonate 5-dehydrogenase
MRALVIDGPRQTRLASRPDPELAPGWALIRPRLVGICGSDLHAYLGHSPFVRYPLIPGHEVVGEVVDVAPPAPDSIWPPGRPPARLRPGQRVALDPAVPCARCYPCRMGRYNACADQQVLGVHLPGAMAELLAARLDCCHIVPDSVPDHIAALAEPLSIGLQACRRGRIQAYDTVAILGAGMIGLSCLLQVRLCGATCAVVEPLAARRELASQLGAEVAVPPEAAREVVADWAPAGGPTVVIDATGQPAALPLALELVAPAGRVVVLSFPPGDLTLPGPLLVAKELDLVGSRLHCRTLPATLALLAARRLNPAPLLSGVEALAHAPQLFADLARGSRQVIKILVQV